MHKYIFIYETKLAPITIISEGDYITGIQFGNNKLGESKIEETDIIKQAYVQISEYLEGNRTFFDIKLKFCGTPFQKSVWKELLQIPYGETRSYKDIAIAIGKTGSYRAVGLANSCNPICIVIPCHRVIGTNGSLTGYAYGIDIKKLLLSLEMNVKLNKQKLK